MNWHRAFDIGVLAFMAFQALINWNTIRFMRSTNASIRDLLKLGGYRNVNPS